MDNSGRSYITMALQRKRARRVSFAEMTSVHFFDRNKEDNETPLAKAANMDRASANELDFGLELEQSKETDGVDVDVENMGMSRSFLQPLGPPFPRGRTIGSALSNDEDILFVPVSACSIRPGQLSDSAASDDIHDVTKDSTAFSMHFRSFARSESGGDLKICLPPIKELVLLHDWWLIKADSDAHGKRLGVGGFATKESQGIRGFLSTPIVKRQDAVTLQTADGTTITISGHLNRSRTLDNGFPLKVCDDFVFGFPYYWEEFAALSFDRLETTSKNSDQATLNAFPVAILRDLSIGNLKHHESSLTSNDIFDDVLHSTGAGGANDGELASKKASPSIIKSSISNLDGASSNHLRNKSQRKHEGSKNALITEPSTNVKRGRRQENNDVADRVLTSGPMTRSRSHRIEQNA